MVAVPEDPLSGKPAARALLAVSHPIEQHLGVGTLGQADQLQTQILLQ